MLFVAISQIGIDSIVIFQRDSVIVLKDHIESYRTDGKLRIDDDLVPEVF